MDKLIMTYNDQLVTSSRQVADSFGKEHKNVLTAIREILVAQKSATKFFYESEHEYRGRKFPMYYMNRDGFSLLVMGFTGEQALEWKIKYINAFNEMEKELATPKLTPAPRYRARQLSTALKDMEKTKETLQKIFKVGDGIAYAKAVSLVEATYGVQLDIIKDMLPAADTLTAYLTPTEIGQLLGKSAREVNLLLVGYGFQHKEGNKVWRLDEAGRKYGEEMPYERNGHSGYQIRWNEQVVDYIQNQLEEDAKKKREIDIELAAKLRKLTHKEWHWVINAIRLSYDSLLERGIDPTMDKIAQMIYDVLIAEKQRRMVVGQN